MFLSILFVVCERHYVHCTCTLRATGGDLLVAERGRPLVARALGEHVRAQQQQTRPPRAQTRPLRQRCASASGPLGSGASGGCSGRSSGHRPSSVKHRVLSLVSRLSQYAIIVSQCLSRVSSGDWCNATRERVGAQVECSSPSRGDPLIAGGARVGVRLQRARNARALRSRAAQVMRPLADRADRYPLHFAHAQCAVNCAHSVSPLYESHIARARYRSGPILHSDPLSEQQITSLSPLHTSLIHALHNERHALVRRARQHHDNVYE